MIGLVLVLAGLVLIAAGIDQRRTRSTVLAAIRAAERRQIEREANRGFEANKKARWY